MSETEADLGRAKELGHEPTDVDAVALTYIGLVLLLIILVCVGTVFGMNWLFSGLYPQLRQPMTQVGVEPGPAQPGVGPFFSTGLGELQAHKNALLSGYGWVDRDKGIAHIPIEQAMALVAQRGLTGTGPLEEGEQAKPKPAPAAAPGAQAMGAAALASVGAQTMVPSAGQSAQQTAAQPAGRAAPAAAGPPRAEQPSVVPTAAAPQKATPKQAAAAPSPAPGGAPSLTSQAARAAPAAAATPERFTIQQSLFEQGSATLQGRARQALNRVAARLRAAQQKGPMQVQVRSYTDSSGSAAYNLRLSARRAAAVRRYLISQGVIGEYVSVQGMGEAKPIASNTTAAGRARNRRIEIEVQPVIPGVSEAPPSPGATKRGK